MKLIGWALALSAAIMTPAMAAAPQVTTTATAAAQISAPGAAGVADPATVAAPAAASVQAFPATAPTPGVGMPGGRLGLQDQFTELGQRAASFHNGPLLLMCLVISAFVLLLLGYTMFRFRRGANPTPSRNTHHTMLEVVWTLVPVLVLVAIAIPSIRLLAAQYSPPPADLTIKVVGHQWYWTYQYPDNGGFEIVSNQLREKGDPALKPGERFRTDADGPIMLATDERLVIPAGKVVKFLITSEDVIHAFAVPAFWTKMDAVPGRLNQEWVKVDRPGVYFGQCSELCGARHGYMPIAVEVLAPAKFDAWLASKGGTPKGAKPIATPAAAATAPADPAAIEQPALTQPVTAQN
ncbi:MAG: cytochrome c oxidase subunit II [Sphingomonas bacterium]|nr:cytochrome c oxidase subunit II [Sphingomonas bacterium]